MGNSKVNIAEKFTKISDLWNPKVIAEMNNYQFKLAKVKGEFIWHSHKETDEAFIIIEGKLSIELRSKVINLSKGVEHKPYAERECQIMLVEPKGVVNTGEFHTNQTAPNDQWL